MKYIFLLQLLITYSFASITTINNFEADFTQVVLDEKNKKLTYSGHIRASKPQYALWEYTQPIHKSIYIVPGKVTIIEPDLEQAIEKKLQSNFDFFSMLKDAKKIDKQTYIAKFQNTHFTILLDNEKLKSISYSDELDNKVSITFKNQVQNIKIQESVYRARIPADYDIIRD